MQRNYTNAKRRYQEEVGDVFESCPRGFAQLYTMSAIIDHCAVPCVYGVLPNKERATYVHFFESIRRSIGNNWNPMRIMSDFETAAIDAADAIFPNSAKSGCLFHYGQALYRRVQRLPNLHTQYLQDAEFQRSIRSLQPTVELRELILYFVNTWLGPRHIIENEEPLHDPHGQNMGGVADGWIRGRIEAMNLGHRDALFPIPLWNMVDRVAQGLSRTNNSLECWHGVWNVHLREDGMWEDRLADFHAAPADGIRGPHQIRKGKYVRQDNNLTALLADFNNREPLAYLRAVSYHYDYCRNYPLKQSKLEE
uniref:MULE transposase domain-containing protein n=1 Tax=Globodera rostochiensis TaxID=31243 RepID=A0A914GUX8_GLORO